MASDVVKSMYGELKRILKVEKKLRYNSVLLSFLKIKSNQRLAYLERTSCTKSMFIGQLDELLSRGDIQHFGDGDKYCITAQYVWKQEKEALLENNCIPVLFDEEYFNCPKAEGISEKERVIIYTLLVARAFSLESAMDLKTGEQYWSKWEDLVGDAYNVLKDAGMLEKLKREDLYSKKSTENKVSALFRHTDSLPKKTLLRFIAPGMQRYFLDLVDKDQKVIPAEVTAILKIAFPKNLLDLERIDALSKACIEIAYSKGMYLTEVKNPYIDTKVDGIMKRCFEELLL